MLWGCEREIIVNNFLSYSHPSKQVPRNLSFDRIDFMVGATYNAVRVSYSVIRVSSYKMQTATET